MRRRGATDAEHTLSIDALNEEPKNHAPPAAAMRFSCMAWHSGANGVPPTKLTADWPPKAARMTDHCAAVSKPDMSVAAFDGG